MTINPLASLPPTRSYLIPRLATEPVHATGAVTGRAETLERFRATPRRINRGELSVRLLGDTAVLLGTLDNHIPVPGGPDRTMHGVAMQVLRRAGTAWLFEAFQMTLLPG